MANKYQGEQTERKVWARPALKRMHAGSAEARRRDGIPDGSETPGQARS